MWSAFIVGPALLVAATTLLILTGGAQFVLAASTLTYLQRRKGFRPNEGFGSRRANDVHYGVECNTASEYDICVDLGFLAQIAPESFNKIATLRFDLTFREGIYLKDLLIPTMEAAVILADAKQALEQYNSAENVAILVAAAENFSKILRPVVQWMEEFPKARTKKRTN